MTEKKNNHHTLCVCACTLYLMVRVFFYFFDLFKIPSCPYIYGMSVCVCVGRNIQEKLKFNIAHDWSGISQSLLLLLLSLCVLHLIPFHNVCRFLLCFFFIWLNFQKKKKIIMLLPLCVFVIVCRFVLFCWIQKNFLNYNNSNNSNRFQFNRFSSFENSIGLDFIFF